MKFNLTVLVLLMLFPGCLSRNSAGIEPLLLEGYVLPGYLKTKVVIEKLEFTDVDFLLKEKWSDEYEVYDKNGKFKVTNCEECFNAQLAKREPKTNMDRKPYAFWQLQCKATKLFSAAVKSKQSFIRKVKFDESVSGLLPAEFDFGQDAKNHKNWRESAELTGFKKHDSNFEFIGPGFIYRFYRIAYGDFDGDGIEDLLLLIQTGATEGTYGLSELFLCTKMDDESRISVLKKYSAFE